MQTQIEQTYRSTNEALNDIYRKRKRTLLYQKIMWSIVGIFFILILLNIVASYFPDSQLSFLKQFSTSGGNPYGTMYFILALVLLTYPSTYAFTKAFQTFRIKESASISKMVKELFPNVDFEQNTPAPNKEIANSKLFAWVNPDSAIYNYGQIRANINDRNINIHDIGIIEENVSRKISIALSQIPLLNIFVILYELVFKNIFTSKITDNVLNNFRGMFCYLSFSKKLQGHTVVLTNNQKTKIDRLASFNFNDEQKVILEDVRFTNKFIVYSTDQVEARYVLSPAIMERVIALEEKFKRAILLSFQDKMMYLAVENKHGLFSFSSGKLDDIKIVDELAKDIETALCISEYLRTD